MEVPTQSLQYSLTQTISVTGRARAVVRRPITLNSQNIATGIVGIFDRDINKITCRPHLWFNFIIALTECFNHLKLKRRVRRFTSFPGDLQLSSLCKFEEIL
ncbi:hypothetical protein D3C76_1382420 [compost metagenome]